MIPRAEHPNPQMYRENWLNLNGVWEFEIDASASGRERKLYEAASFSRTINVPFCPESELSGVQFKDFMAAVWYRRTVTLPDAWAGKRVILHFGAVDYRAYVYVNSRFVGEHKGGYVSFAFDITDFLTAGENVIHVCAEDDTRSSMQPRGKQSETCFSRLCDYTRTTGIWQTVWLECVPRTYIKELRYTANPEDATVRIGADVVGNGVITAKVTYEGRLVGEAAATTSGCHAELFVALSEAHLWEVGHGRLYDVELTYGDDVLKSYFGLRSVELTDVGLRINGKPVFQRLVLDQGFYPTGIYTAPTEEDLVADITRSLDCGFNGARLHQKIFEQRFLYHCDRLGYIVWGEFPSWDVDMGSAEALYAILPEWMEEIRRDRNHPAIITWCPLNESHPEVCGKRIHDENLRMIYRVTKELDPSRPCIDVSGYAHVVTDIYDVHDYDQNPKRFREHYAAFLDEGTLYDWKGLVQTYTGGPIMNSEIGGINWHPGDSDEDHWVGYGEAPKSSEAFIALYKGIIDAHLDHPKMMGFCYTQLTDIEQEKNGLFYYDRRPKFDPALLKAINERPAAYELGLEMTGEAYMNMIEE